MLGTTVLRPLFAVALCSLAVTVCVEPALAQNGKSRTSRKVEIKKKPSRSEQIAREVQFSTRLPFRDKNLSFQVVQNRIVPQLKARALNSGVELTQRGDRLTYSGPPKAVAKFEKVLAQPKFSRFYQPGRSVSFRVDRGQPRIEPIAQRLTGWGISLAHPTSPDWALVDQLSKLANRAGLHFSTTGFGVEVIGTPGQVRTFTAGERALRKAKASADE